LAAVGAGAGTGTVIDRVTKRKIKSDVEWAVPVAGSGIVVVFDEKWGSAHVVRGHEKVPTGGQLRSPLVAV
jgi:hypothetical protein